MAIQESSVEKFFTTPIAANEPESYRRFHQESRKKILARSFESIKRWEMLGMMATTIGGGLAALVLCVIVVTAILR